MHKLPIEAGRHEGIERHERTCITCGELGDEFHYLFKCSNFRDSRKLFLSESLYLSMPNSKLRNKASCLCCMYNERVQLKRIQDYWPVNS